MFPDKADQYIFTLQTKRTKPTTVLLYIKAPYTFATKVSQTQQSPFVYPAKRSLPDTENAMQVTAGMSLSPCGGEYT